MYQIVVILTVAVLIPARFAAQRFRSPHRIVTYLNAEDVMQVIARTP